MKHIGEEGAEDKVWRTLKDITRKRGGKERVKIGKGGEGKVEKMYP